MILEYVICSIYEDIINAIIQFLQEWYYTSQVDKAWQKTWKWKMEEENSLRKKGEEMEKNLDKDPVDLDVVSKESQGEYNSSDKDYIPDEQKGKYEFNTFGNINDMSNKYKHPHHGLRSVRTELYTVMSN